VIRQIEGFSGGEGAVIEAGVVKADRGFGMLQGGEKVGKRTKGSGSDWTNGIGKGCCGEAKERRGLTCVLFDERDEGIHAYPAKKGRQWGLR